jgi:hypothetical protein
VPRPKRYALSERTNDQIRKNSLNQSQHVLHRTHGGQKGSMVLIRIKDSPKNQSHTPKGHTRASRIPTPSPIGFRTAPPPRRPHPDFGRNNAVDFGGSAPASGAVRCASRRTLAAWKALNGKSLSSAELSGESAQSAQHDPALTLSTASFRFSLRALDLGLWILNFGPANLFQAIPPGDTQCLQVSSASRYHSTPENQFKQGAGAPSSTRLVRIPNRNRGRYSTIEIH